MHRVIHKTLIAQSKITTHICVQDDIARVMTMISEDDVPDQQILCCIQLSSDHDVLIAKIMMRKLGKFELAFMCVAEDMSKIDVQSIASKTMRILSAH